MQETSGRRIGKNVMSVRSWNPQSHDPIVRELTSDRLKGG
jgi:hypothetical protein